MSPKKIDDTLDYTLTKVRVIITIRDKRKKEDTMNNFINFSLEGKIALVTGASYGIGFAIRIRRGRRNHLF